MTMLNSVGISPAGHRILVKPDEELEFNKEGKIIIPDDVKARYQMAQTSGTIVAIGKTCWKRDDFGNEPWAQEGDRIMFAKYGGMIVVGMDGNQYRLLNDEDLVAVLHPDFKIGGTQNG